MITIPFWGWFLLSVGCGIVYLASLALALVRAGREKLPVPGVGVKRPNCL